MVKIGMTDNTLVFRHFGDYMGAELNVSLLEVFAMLSVQQVCSLEFVIADCSRVTSVSMQDSDRAAYSVFQRKMSQVFKDKGLKVVEELKRVDAVFIDSEVPAIARLQHERRFRQASEYEQQKIMRHFPSVEAALEGIGRRDLDLDSIEYHDLDKFRALLSR